MSSKPSVENHMKVFHETKQNIINFQGMFRTFADLEVTKIDEKQNEKPTCPTCNKEYFSIADLKRHQKNHETNGNDKQVPNENLKCQKCNKYFINFGNFNRHMKNL